MNLYSRCCGAPDKIFRKVLAMTHSEMGICPKCGSHCDFTNYEIIQQLNSIKNGGGLVKLIQQSIARDLSHIDIFQFIKDQSQTNIEEVYEAIGQSLTQKIIE